VDSLKVLDPERPIREADVVGLSGPVDARGVAPRRGEMDVQVRCFHIRKLALYRRFDVSAFDNLPARHHPGGIKAAHGDIVQRGNL
jgi:hypothetical protein